MFLETLFWFLVVVFVLVLVHELGHFTFAKLFGVEVKEFAIGFRPRIFSYKYRNTTYTINSVPLGGFVDITGINGENLESKNSFSQKNLIQKLLILFGGILFNLIFAFFAFIVIFQVGYEFPKVLVNTGGEVRLEVVGILEKDNSIGLQENDKIIGFASVKDFTDNFKTADRYIFPTTILREEERLSVDIDKRHLQDTEITFLEKNYIKANIAESIVLSSSIIYNTFGLFGGLIKNIFVQADENAIKGSLTGPVGIAKQSAIAVDEGVLSFIFFLALLSISLAFFNLLPLPILDGGLILFTLIEDIFRFKIGKKTRSALVMGSLFLLIFLLLFITKNDLGI